MIKEFLARIMREVIRKLLYPELVEIRQKLQKIADINNNIGTKEDFNRNDPELLNTISQYATNQKKDMDQFKTSLNKNMEIDIDIKNKLMEISEEVRELQGLESSLAESISRQQENSEKSFERISKKNNAQSLEIKELNKLTRKLESNIIESTEKSNYQINEEFKKFNKRLDDLYKIMVKKEEHEEIVNDVDKLRLDLEKIKMNATR